VPAALQFCAAVCAVGFVLLILSFQAPTLGLFIPLFALGELALFSVNACVNAAVMWSVPLRLRSLSMSIMTIAIHIFGDVPAPPLVGRFQDYLAATRGANPNNWRLSLGLVTCTLAVSGVLFHLAARIARQGEASGGGGGGGAGGTQGEMEEGEQAEGAAVPLLAEEAGAVEDGSFFAPLPKQEAAAAQRRAR
jgi:hypothetical protein